MRSRSSTADHGASASPQHSGGGRPSPLFAWLVEPRPSRLRIATTNLRTSEASTCQASAGRCRGRSASLLGAVVHRIEVAAPPRKRIHLDPCSEALPFMVAAVNGFQRRSVLSLPASRARTKNDAVRRSGGLLRREGGRVRTDASEGVPWSPPGSTPLAPRRQVVSRGRSVQLNPGATQFLLGPEMPPTKAALGNA
jgi:hypothetical protein